MALVLRASESKKRRAGLEAEEHETAAAAGEDHISALPEDLRLRILALLPLKSAIRTGALSSRWRPLWARRWPAPSSLDLQLRSGDTPGQHLESLEPRRLDRFSLTIHRGVLWAFRLPNLRPYLAYAAACDVEDLHIHIADGFMSRLLMFHFRPGFSHLARLSFSRVGRVCFGFSLNSDAFSALEVIHLHSVRYVDLCNLLSACPRLRTLDVRYCEGVRGAIYFRLGGAHLRSLTVAECNNVTMIDAYRASSLRSFRLSSAFLPTYDIPATASLDDLYISLRGNVRNPLSHWIRALPNLANLTTLTICSIALRRVYALARFGSATCLSKLRSLPTLRELQLLMFEMDSTNLAHMYMFFRTCRCSQLERHNGILSHSLPKSSHDTFVDNSSEVAEEEGPNEDLSEEDEPDGELYEEDEPDGELLEEEETEEELLEQEIIEEYMLEDRLFYEDMYEEDPADENVPEEEQSVEDVSKYGLNNLIFAKVMRFKGHYFEMRLVSFLLRRATGLKKLLLVAPEGNHMESLGVDPTDTSCSLETKLSPHKQASPNVEIILSESDHTAIHPVHSDVFAGF